MNEEIPNKNINLRRIIYTFLVVLLGPILIVISSVIGFSNILLLLSVKLLPYLIYLPTIFAATVAFFCFKPSLGAGKALGVALVAGCVAYWLTNFLIVHFHLC